MDYTKKGPGDFEAEENSHFPLETECTECGKDFTPQILNQFTCDFCIMAELGEWEEFSIYDEHEICHQYFSP